MERRRSYEMWVGKNRCREEAGSCPWVRRRKWGRGLEWCVELGDDVDWRWRMTITALR